MRNITFSADGALIDAARERAAAEGSALNVEFRRWLEEYAGRTARADVAMQAIDDLHELVKTGGRRFTREELNER